MFSVCKEIQIINKFQKKFVKFKKMGKRALFTTSQQAFYTKYIINRKKMQQNTENFTKNHHLCTNERD